MIPLVQINAMMEGLVTRYGDYDAVAALLTHALAPHKPKGWQASKSTISRKMNRTLDWTIAEMSVLEDAVRSWPCTDMLYRRKEPASHQAGDVADVAQSVARETGEAVAALTAAAITADDEARAIAKRELEEAAEVIARALEALDAASGARSATIPFRGVVR